MLGSWELTALSRPVVGDFHQLSNTVAVSGRLDYAPAFVPGFAGSVSGYYTPNTLPSVSATASTTVAEIQIASQTSSHCITLMEKNTL